eukprot:CAMPEP_0171813490 /NCGR_PEP_ID=MMETSP0991-20121206/79242_1 /TAXON_ID=483369 /ORGANISM="non described non described, Strain CCMP2098" /LENGTH=52 /DNA_ID=CAMNT_0012427073 /DNA_START=646 /DNA_END=804 /DNA_ORIENTATION=-
MTGSKARALNLAKKNRDERQWNKQQCAVDIENGGNEMKYRKNSVIAAGEPHA